MFISNLRNLLTKSGKYIGGVASLVTIDGYIRDIRDKNIKVKYEAELTRNTELENKIQSLLEDKILNEENKNKVLEVVSRRSHSLDIVRNDLNKIELGDNYKSDLNEQTKENITTELNEQIGNLSVNINKVNNDLSDLIDLIMESSNKYCNEFNSIIEESKYLITSYQNFLNTLTLEQKGALAHILTSIFILLFYFV